VATLQQHTGIGAGLHIAMKDLEIRGAGNLLGGEQSGHVAAVGFDLYVKMIGEAVRELRGDGPAERAEVRVELPVDAHIPHDYVTGERLRLEAYTAIASIDSAADIAAIRDELNDRFGTVPPQVENLLAVARLRFMARNAGLTDIMLQGNYIRFAPVKLPDSRTVRLQRLYPGAVLKPTVSTMLLPVPKAVPGARAGSGSSGGPGARAGAGQTISLGAPPLRDQELLTWCEELIEAVLSGLEPAGPDGTPGGSST
jgi:transcription-repair coupling factor (superfamily II helicase)